MLLYRQKLLIVWLNSTLSVKPPENAVFKAFRLFCVPTLCIFPCFCPYEPKQGKVFFVSATLSSDLAEVPEIHDKVSQSIRKSGWLPNLFHSIVSKAKDFLQNLICEHEMPPKPSLSINMAEFRTMRNLMIQIQDEARTIRSLQEKSPS